MGLDQIFKYKIGDRLELIEQRRLCDEQVAARDSRYFCPWPQCATVSERVLIECHGGAQLSYAVAFSNVSDYGVGSTALVRVGEPELQPYQPRAPKSDI